MTLRILIIASHPDDECLGAGGTISRLAAEGNEVSIGILATGLTARGEATQDELGRLQEQARKAGFMLGAKAVTFCDGPDNQMDTIPLLEVVRSIEEMLEFYGPEIVYTQHGGDLNRDHQLTYHATLIATRPMMGAPVKEVYAYEVPSSTEWAFGQFSPAFHPNTFVDISGEYLERKLKAMEMYETERRPFPHPRSPEALRALAMWRGAQSGCMAAEAFQLVRLVR